MRVFLVILLSLTLAACGDPTYAPLHPDAVTVGEPAKVLVMTNRAKDPSGFYGGNRSDTPDFLEIAVSIPRDRDIGTIPISYRQPVPGKHFVLTGRRSIDGHAAFRRALRQQMAALPVSEKEITIYVHGYNNSFSDGVFRTAQLVHDFHLKGLALHYSWPSAAHPLAYAHDRDSLLFARDGLEQLLLDVEQAGARNVILVGHSLGAMLVMETLRQMDIRRPGHPERILDGLVLLSPDIDLELFRTQAHRITALPQPFAIFVSQKDRALMLSSEVNGRSQRLGALANPEALADLDVIVLDVTAFSDRQVQTHFVPGTSPALINLLSQSYELNQGFEDARTGARGALPGVALTVQKATQIVLSPGLFGG